MSIAFELSAGLEEVLASEIDDLSQFAKQAFVVHAYRDGRISIGCLARELHMGVMEADAWLAKLGVPLLYNFEDFCKDLETLEEYLPQPDKK